MLDQQKFKELKSNGNLPSPAGSALKIIELCQRSNVALPELVHAIQTDPALTGRVVKLANSPVFGRKRPVVSLSPDVLMTIGTQSLRQIVLAFSLVASNRNGSCDNFDYQTFWSKSVATGVAAQLLGAAIRVAPPVELFTCGLLSQVGQLALAAIHPEQYSAFLKKTERQSVETVSMLEEEVFGFTHLQVSAALMGEWGIPKLFTDAVLFHETPVLANLPDESRSARLVWILHLSERLASLCFMRDADRIDMLPTLGPVGEKLGLSAETLLGIANQMLGEWKEWSAMLELSVHEVAPFSESELTTVTGIAAVPDEEAGSDVDVRPDVLIVDDDPATLMLLKKLLTTEGYRVHAATNAEEALRMVLAFHPRILLTDWMMPGMSGLDLIHSLRETEVGQSMYVIVLTSKRENESLVDAFDAGADDFLVKPIEPIVLKARLKAGLRVIGVQRKLEQDRDQLHRLAAELTIAHQRASEFALTDALTGLHNRRYAMDRLAKEWMAADRNHQPLSILILDIDHFKTVNDTYGHDIGDTVLKHFAEILQGLSRSPDVTCRIGGEEFCVIIPGSTLEGAVQYAERIRASFAQQAIDVPSGKLHLTVSIGVAQKSSAIPDFGQLLKTADDALYRAKREGRNRVIVALGAA